MEVKMAFVADYANVDASGKMNVIGMFKEMNFDSLPAMVPSLNIVAVFEVPIIEMGQTKKLKTTLVDQDGKNPLFDLEQEWTAVRPQNHPDGRPMTLNLVIQLNGIQFATSGDYQCIFLVNGEQKTAIAIHVNEPKIN